jgi:hypothetical protein
MGGRARGHHPRPLPAGPADPRRGADPGPGRRRARPGHRDHQPVLERRQHSGPARRPRLLRPGPIQAPPAPAAGTGSTKISDLYREITADGYQGSYTTAWNWLAIPRLAAPPRPPAPPTTAQVTALLTADPATQDQDTRDQVSAILARCPALTALTPHITGFARLITGLYDSTKAGSKLDTWLAAVAPRCIVEAVAQPCAAVVRIPPVQAAPADERPVGEA